MRRFFGVLSLCFSVALVAAVPTATPTPPPSLKLVASPTPPSVAYAPSVLIYPFDQSAQMPADTGKQVAEIYAEAISASPGVNIAGLGLGIQRADYLTYARGKKADFYIAGYMTAVGSGAAIVEQIVDTGTGIIVYSQTAQVFSAPETASLALNARSFMLAREGGDNTDVSAGDSKAPEPTSTNGAQVSINNVGGLFHHGKGTAAAATPTPALPPRPARGMYLVRVGGASPVSELTSATQELTAALAPYYITKAPGIAVTDVATQANAICGTDRNNTIATGALSEARVGNSYRAHTVYTFVFDVYACFGAKLFESSQSDNSRTTAIGTAVKAYQVAHPGNN